MSAYSILDNSWLQPCASVSHCPSPNFDHRTEAPSLLVIHNISLPPGQFGNGYIHDLFCNQLDAQAHPYFADIAQLKVSAHGLIDRQGHVTQFVGFNDRAWHAGVSCYAGRSQCNDFSIGIELEGTDDEAYTDQQYQQLTALTRALLDYYPTLNTEHITGHSDIAPGRKTDPGPAFDWSLYHRLLA